MPLGTWRPGHSRSAALHSAAAECRPSAGRSAVPASWHDLVLPPASLSWRFGAYAQPFHALPRQRRGGRQRGSQARAVFPHADFKLVQLILHCRRCIHARSRGPLAKFRCARRKSVQLIQNAKGKIFVDVCDFQLRFHNAATQRHRCAGTFPLDPPRHCDNARLELVPQRHQARLQQSSLGAEFCPARAYGGLELLLIGSGRPLGFSRLVVEQSPRASRCCA